MRDEEFFFVSDVIDKKTTARSARNRRTHNGKGGKVRLPSDNLSKKELQKMNGEVKSYKLNSPMTWAEFKSMPDDLRVTYIKLLRERFNVPDCRIADMMGIHRVGFSKYMKMLGASAGSYSRGKDTKWNESEWLAWVNGTSEKPCSGESAESTPEEVSEPFMEEDVAAWEEPDPVPAEPVPVSEYEVKRVIPHSGSMNLEGDIREVLETISVLLGGVYTKVCVSWEVCQPEGVCEHG